MTKALEDMLNEDFRGFCPARLPNLAAAAAATRHNHIQAIARRRAGCRPRNCPSAARLVRLSAWNRSNRRQEPCSVNVGERW